MHMEPAARTVLLLLLLPLLLRLGICRAPLWGARSLALSAPGGGGSSAAAEQGRVRGGARGAAAGQAAAAAGLPRGAQRLAGEGPYRGELGPSPALHARQLACEDPKLPMCTGQECAAARTPSTVMAHFCLCRRSRTRLQPEGLVRAAEILALPYCSAPRLLRACWRRWGAARLRWGTGPGCRARRRGSSTAGSPRRSSGGCRRWWLNRTG